MSAAGIIFSNVHDDNIRELTRARTIASVPFGCRYRFIDFTLSNMVNSNIYNISVITNNNYLSLMDHIGSGKDWDLARRSGGIKMLPPNVSTFAYYGAPKTVSRLEALKSVNYSISKIKDEYVVLSDCDVICNIDLTDIIEYHAAEKADITLAVKKMTLTAETAKSNVILSSDENCNVTDILTYPNNFEGEAEVCLNLLVMRTDFLEKIILDSIARNYTSLTKDVIAKNIGRYNFKVYRYDGYFATIASMEDYFKYSMDLINDDEARNALFGVKNRPVLTKVRNSAPTYYSEDSKVKNSMIADGCVIEGTVENSILFRGVKVGRGTTVKNCILMQDTVVGENTLLNCVVSDKNVVIRDGVMLSGVDSQPYYISKRKMI